MTNRDRFRAAMAFEPTDRPCHIEHGFWHETYLRWQAEGLPADVKEPVFAYLGEGPDLFDHFGLTRYGYLLPSQYFLDWFTPEVLEETDSYLLQRDGMGRVVKTSKLGPSLPQYLEHPVKCRRDYEALKERLAPAPERRYPAGWDAIAAAMRAQQDVVVCTHMDGFFAYPRELIGVEAMLYLLYDDPGLMRDLIADRCDFYIQVYERAIRDAKPDFAFIWEDMCFANGPLVSPALFREFMLPAYRRLTGWLRDVGVATVIVDSDGDVRALIPLWLEGGVTGLLPFEVKAGLDVIEIGRQYPALQVVGGIDKHALERGAADIDAEVERVLPAMTERGGYAVSLDHWVQPQIPLASFAHYVEKVRQYGA
jgi:uroporphyrinogen decarboxylase